MPQPLIAAFSFICLLYLKSNARKMEQKFQVCSRLIVGYVKYLLFVTIQTVSLLLIVSLLFIITFWFISLHDVLNNDKIEQNSKFNRDQFWDM